MANTLDENLNIIAENSGLEIELLNGDLNIIQKLDDEPNDVGGLTSAELKAKFDEGPNKIKEYINGTLIPEILAADATEAARAAAEEQRGVNETQRIENENARIAAEQARVDETNGIVAQAAAQAKAAAESAAQAKQIAIGDIPDGTLPESKLVEEARAAIDRAKAGGAIDITLQKKSQEIDQIKTDVNVLDSRMNEFTSLPEGSTSGNAELADIRVGHDGTSYDSAGQAVRSQVGQLNGDLSHEKDVLGESDDNKTTNLIDENALTQSKMIANDGSIVDATNNTWYVTDFLDIGHEKVIYLKVEDTSINLIHCYDENQNPIGDRITSSSNRLISHTTYYDVNLYPGTRYVRVNVREAWLGRYMLTKYFYPSSYVESGTYANRTPSTVASKAEEMFRKESGIVRTYYSSWNAQLTDGKFSLLDMPQNTIAYVNLSEIDPTEIVGLPFSSGAVYVDKVGRGSYSMYRIYRNQVPWCAIGYYNGTSFVWVSSTNWQELKIGMLGDSVTEGRIGGQSGITDNGIPYWVGYETGLPVVNLGVGNMGWVSHQYLETNAYEYLQTLDLSSYKVLTFQYGLNDGDIPLGTYTDTTTDTIMGSVYKCLEYVYSQNPTVQVIMINPTVGSKPASFPYFNPNGHHSASDGWTFTQYFEQMRLFCDKYAIPLIDGWKGYNAWNRATLMGDNVHPTVAGYKVVGRYIAGQIKSMI